MSPAYDRPFQPIELEDSERRKFAVRPILAQLRGEKSLAESGRASLTLVHGPGLTAVLTVARAGALFEEHQAAGPTLFLVVSGELSVAPLGGAAVLLAEDDMFALGPDVRHVVEARSECAFFTIIGEQQVA